MKKYFLKAIVLSLIAVLLMLSVGACAPTSPDASSSTTGQPTQGTGDAQAKYAGKKIVYVNSYHEGYPWSDGIEAGLHKVLDGTGVELKIIRLDTKQHPEAAFGQEAGQKAKAEIDAFKPDVVITSDDNSQKYLVAPYLKGTGTPVIFNGVNWDASAYGYSPDQITGMVEVELPDQLVDLLKSYTKGERLGYITIDTETERKVSDIYNQRFFGGQMKTYWVTNQEEFKTAFLQAQQEVDILFIGNNAGSSDTWDEAAMKQFFLANTTIPTGSINDWMAPYALLTLAKSSEEQGEWSAQAALKILDGMKVSDIPVAQNKKGQLIANLMLADKLKIVFAPSVLKNAVILDK
jgi:ABC-type uncharacterized transport system substrate-binding protein